MNALIIGGVGFVGLHLIDHLLSNGWSVAVSKLPFEQMAKRGIDIHDLDVMDPSAIQVLLKKLRPDCIFHLAAQSSVALSWKNPELTIDVNVKGTLNLLEALRALDYKPRVLLVGSGEEYGLVRAQEVPIGEETPLRPGNIYAATKACGEMFGSIYARAYGLDVMMVRAFNHIGPGQSTQFVVGDFCKQVAEIEAGKQKPVIRVGNLSARRDFTDVRDVVRAYRLLIEKGQTGQIYNVGSGRSIAIQLLLDMILQQSTTEIAIEVGKEKLRPVDVPVIEADYSRLRADTGWVPEVPLEKTIARVLTYCRENTEK